MKKFLIISVLVFLAVLCSCGILPSDELTTGEFTTEEPVSMVYKKEKVSEVETETESETISETETKAETETKLHGEIVVEPVIDYEEPEIYEEDEEPVEYEEPANDNHGSYIGNYELTAYEWTGEQMANGEYPYFGACACNSLPLGTRVYIEGHGTFVVKDRGGMGNNVIDIYLGDPDECWAFGRQEADVYYD